MITGGLRAHEREKEIGSNPEQLLRTEQINP
jgi:hypothetical protein